MKSEVVVVMTTSWSFSLSNEEVDGIEDCMGGGPASDAILARV